MKRTEVEQKYKWAVEDVFPSDEAWEVAFDALAPKIGFAKYRGTLNTAENLVSYFKEEEALAIEVMRVYLYAFLKHDEDVGNTKYMGYMGKMMGLNPAVILLALSVWGALLGFIGLIVALPLTTLLLSYYRRFIERDERRVTVMENRMRRHLKKRPVEEGTGAGSPRPAAGGLSVPSEGGSGQDAACPSPGSLPEAQKHT